MNVNKKIKKFDTNRFCMNKTNIECYNYHEKNHIFRHCFKSTQKDSKKKQELIDVISIVSINKNDFIYHMIVMLTLMINRNRCVYKS